MNRVWSVEQIPAPRCRGAAEKEGETSRKRYRCQRRSESFHESGSTTRCLAPPDYRGPGDSNSLSTVCNQPSRGGSRRLWILTTVHKHLHGLPPKLSARSLHHPKCWPLHRSSTRTSFGRWRRRYIRRRGTTRSNLQIRYRRQGLVNTSSPFPSRLRPTRPRNAHCIGKLRMHFVPTLTLPMATYMNLTRPLWMTCSRLLVLSSWDLGQAW
jgi:hypothetical protein